MPFIPPTGAAIAQALQERWGYHLEPGEHLEVEVERTAAGMRVVAAVVRGPERVEFEAEAAGGAEAAFDGAVDAADALVGDWLEAGRPRPRGVPELRGEVRVVSRLRRPDLEAEADRILGEHGED